MSAADGHFAHRFVGGPRPLGRPKYGMARAVHEWKMGGRAILGAAIAAGLLQAAVWYVDDAGQSASPRSWQAKTAVVAAVSLVVAVAYTVSPKQPPRGVSAERRESAGSRR